MFLVVGLQISRMYKCSSFLIFSDSSNSYSMRSDLRRRSFKLNRRRANKLTLNEEQDMKTVVSEAWVTSSRTVLSIYRRWLENCPTALIEVDESEFRLFLYFFKNLCRSKFAQTLISSLAAIPETCPWACFLLLI